MSLALYLRKAQTPQLVEYVLDRSRQLHQVSADTERANPAICMLHVEGRLRRRGDMKTRVLHVAEVLAGVEG